MAAAMLYLNSLTLPRVNPTAARSLNAGRVTSLGLARDQNHPASSPRGYEPYV
jgi:hypothetical protein